MDAIGRVALNGWLRCGAVALFVLGANPVGAQQPATQITSPASALAEYRDELASFRHDFGGSYALPACHFFLFGMGLRAKLFYEAGVLRESSGGKVIRQWAVRDEIIDPSEYAVSLTTVDGQQVRIVEDERAVWIEENGTRKAATGTRSPLHLPTFTGWRYPRVMRVLHQELLVNVIDGKPVPNYFVYLKPWYRDGAMMAMCFKATGNLDTIKSWIEHLDEPFDRNNAGESEADNLGEALYLISLAGNPHHPLVEKVLDEARRFEVNGPDGRYIKGRSDFASRPVYQTKWMKFGLAALKLTDPYTIPREPDAYSSLFWMDFRDQYVAGHDAADRGSYPYLGWATDHFHGTKQSPISNQDYPLTWEKDASQADYAGIKSLSGDLASSHIAAPHSWHAAEVFLYLKELKAAAK